MATTPRSAHLFTELRVAADAARTAGAAILPYHGTVTAWMKPGNTPVTEADLAANEIILAALERAFPEDAILSEESADSTDRLGRRRLWVVDPLDGTREFLNRTGDFAVMIGLAVDGHAALGVIYRPIADVLYAAVVGQGSWAEHGRGREKLCCGPVDESAIRLATSPSGSEPLVEEVRMEFGITDIRPIGSVAAKCASIAEDRRDLYLHPVDFLGEWDTCAPEVVLREAGGHVSDCGGKAFRYNKPVPNQPDGILATGRVIDSRLIDRITTMYRAGKDRHVSGRYSS